MLAVRRREETFGLGAFREVDVDNTATFAYLREHGDTTLLCVFNFSPHPQPVEIKLRGLDGLVPVELTGGARFPRVTAERYQLTLPGHGFYWFRLEAS